MNRRIPKDELVCFTKTYRNAPSQKICFRGDPNRPRKGRRRVKKAPPVVVPVIVPREDPSKKVNEDNKSVAVNFFKESDELLNLIYTSRKPGEKTYENLENHFKVRREFIELITSNDFYPTPDGYSKIIYDEVFRDYDHVDRLYDIGAGLASLSSSFIKDSARIDKIILVEKNEILYENLKKLEKIKKLDVVNTDALKYKITFKKDDVIIFVSNPPFSASIGGKVEKMAWVFFLVYLNSLVVNSMMQEIYMIVPESNVLRLSGRNKYDLIEMTIPTALEKRISSYLDIEPDDMVPSFIQYISDVEGFRGLTKHGAVRNLGIRAILIKIGL